MRGYYTGFCYMGWVERHGRYMPFASDKEYAEVVGHE